MIQVVLKNGDIKEYVRGISIAEVAQNLHIKLPCAAEVDGQLCDLRDTLNENCTLTIFDFSSPEGRDVYWHTSSHILAEAVTKIFPHVKLGLGRATETGFYYDFAAEQPFSAEDLEVVEQAMRALLKQVRPIERFCLDQEKGKALLHSQPYKIETLEKHAQTQEPLSFYRQEDFVDLCKGPHLLDTSGIKAIKLLSSSSAYWQGDSSREVLYRIYGVTFPSQKELDAYLKRQEILKKRDHSIIGPQLHYYTISEYIGQGLPCFMPKGAKLMQTLMRYIEDKEEQEFGYVLTKTPLMAKSDLYKLSGHWDHYKTGMFIIGDEDKDKEVFALRPMTCPFQYQVYLSEKHSYRDLPLRYSETSTLFRNEASGEMHGLIRMRQFTISEGHLVVRPDQLEEEFKSCLQLIKEVMQDIGLIDDVSYRFSRWNSEEPEKYEGTPEMWREAEDTMRSILEHLNIDYKEGIGEAAFYGPKLDIQIKNVHGKEDTLITLQIDMMLAKKFGMTYTDADNEQKTPYIIHRTSVGCYERTIALLLEKYAGALPIWMSPEQVRILSITDANKGYAEEVLVQLKKAGIRCFLDGRNEKISYKIRQAQMEKTPYMLIIGAKEEADRVVAVRTRVNPDTNVMPVSDFIVKVEAEIKEKVHDGAGLLSEENF